MQAFVQAFVQTFVQAFRDDYGNVSTDDYIGNCRAVRRDVFSAALARDRVSVYPNTKSA